MTTVDCPKCKRRAVLPESVTFSICGCGQVLKEPKTA